MSEGYEVASKPAKGFEYIEGYPAGSMSVSAADMAKYMIAHLQNGEYNGAQILKPETAQLMHSRAFGLVPEMNGMAYGFYEESRNGHRIVGHGGDTQWFHSDMHLMPDQNLGFFVSYNSAGKGGDGSTRDVLWHNFLDRFFRYTPPEAKATSTAASDAQSVAGAYWSSRRPEKSILSALAMLDEGSVKANPDGTVSLSFIKDFAGNAKHFRELAPMVFREDYGQSRLAFIDDYAGRRIIVIDVPFAVLQPVPPLKKQIPNLAILFSSLAVFGLTLLSWPFNAMLRWHYHYGVSLSTEYRRTRRLMRILCALNIVLFAGLVTWITLCTNNLGLLSSHFDTRLRVLQLLALLDILGVIVSIVFFVRSWRELDLWFWARVWNSLLMVACIGYAYFLVNWRLLSVSLNY